MDLNRGPPSVVLAPLPTELWWFCYQFGSNCCTYTRERNLITPDTTYFLNLEFLGVHNKFRAELRCLAGVL